jgi:hypothetical protein
MYSSPSPFRGGSDEALKFGALSGEHQGKALDTW